MVTYCERAGTGPWDEPLNAVTNLAFLAAAALAWHRYRREPGLRASRAPDLLLLIACLAAIGLGSGLWHTLATPWAAAADVIPIALFIALYLLSFLLRVAGAGWTLALALLLAYHGVAAAVAAALPAGLLNGSIGYAPAWAALGAMAWYARARRPILAPDLALAFGLLTLSLALRSVDRAVCPAVPVGTHFLWHLLNAWLLYRLLAALIAAGGRAASAGLARD